MRFLQSFLRWLVGRKGIFSLVVLFLGIFSTAFGAVVATLTLDSSVPYLASYSFSLPPISERVSVPRAVSFNASGTVATFSGVPLSGFPYPPWMEVPLTHAWSPLQSSGSTALSHSFDVAFTRNPLLGGIPANSFLLSRVDTGDQLWLYLYTTRNDFLLHHQSVHPIAPPGVVSTPHAIVTTSERCHLFWIASGGSIHHRRFGAATSEIIAGITGDTNYGLAATVVASDSVEYILLAVVRTTTEVQVVTFVAGDVLSPATNVQTFDLTGHPITPLRMGIAWSPQENRILMSYLSVADETRVIRATFRFPGPWSDIGPIETSAQAWDSTSGFGVSAFSNMERVIVGRNISIAPSQVREFPLMRSSFGAIRNHLGQNRDPRLFYFEDAGTAYAGMVVLLGSTQFHFSQRALVFPSAFSWDATNRVLHLEGPPQLGSRVSAVFEFPEVATDSCHGIRANSGHIPTAVNGQSGIIASSSNVFTVAFDRDMRTASYPEWIGTRIRLIRPDETAVGITYIAASSTSNVIAFSPSIDLDFHTTYRISIASDVISAVGSQLWGPATLSFTTQAGTSGVLSGEIIGLQAFANAARSVPIGDGSEVNATTTFYLRLSAIDPAFNTIDVATISVLLDGAFVASISAIQESLTSSSFHATTTVSVPAGGTSHTIVFQTASAPVRQTFSVQYPTVAPGTPASGAIDVPVTSILTAIANESLASGTVTATSTMLFKGGLQVSATVTYDDPSREIRLAPASALGSQGFYEVRIAGVQDLVGNVLQQTLSYTFTAADVIAPTLVSFAPTQNESGVPVNRHLLLTFSEALATPTASTGTVWLRRGGAPASYAVQLLGATMTIVPDDGPSGGLLPGTTYTLEVGPSVTDPSGNAFAHAPATFTLQFTTQAAPPPPPPAAVRHIANFRTADYLESWAGILPQGTLFVQITADDPSPSTIDTAHILVVSSDGQFQGDQITLIESAPNSGFFRGSIVTQAAAGTIITVTSQADATVQMIVGAYPPPALLNRDAITGLTDAFLDQPVTLIFDRPLDSTSLSAGVRVAPLQNVLGGDLAFVLSPDATQIEIHPRPSWATGTAHELHLFERLRGATGAPTQPETLLFMTRSEATATLDLISGIPPRSGQRVLPGGESLSGSLDIVAETTELFETLTETRQVRFQGPGWLEETLLSEDPNKRGRFLGNIHVPLGVGHVGSATLLFFNRPTLTFTIPPVPTFTKLFPASGSRSLADFPAIGLVASRRLVAELASQAMTVLIGNSEWPLSFLATEPITDTLSWTPVSPLPAGATVAVRIATLHDVLGQPLTIPEFTFLAVGLSGNLPPLVIRELVFFADRHFVGHIDGILPQADLFIQITADDRNGMMRDTTRVRVTSDADLTGFEMDLLESEAHSGLFRGQISIDSRVTTQAAGRIRALAGQRITVESITDPSIRRTIRYQPENRIERVLAWPSPCRGDTITFSFWMTFPGQVELTVYDTAGDEVFRRMIAGKPGENRVPWRLPRLLANGVYFFQIELLEEYAEAAKSGARIKRGRFAVLR